MLEQIEGEKMFFTVALLKVVYGELCGPILVDYVGGERLQLTSDGHLIITIGGETAVWKRLDPLLN